MHAIGKGPPNLVPKKEKATSLRPGGTGFEGKELGHPDQPRSITKRKGVGIKKW